jgi:hypothetical protein
VQNPKSFNLYAYVQNDSVNNIDPMGLMSEATGGYCSPMFSSCAGTGGGGYSGTPFDSGSIIFGGYNEVPASIRGSLMAHDRRVALTTMIYRLTHGSPEGATADEIEKYRASITELIARILSRPECAELFGGGENAVGVLSGTPISVANTGTAIINLQTQTAKVTSIETDLGNRTMTINRSGGFFTSGQYQAPHPFLIGVSVTMQGNNWGLQGSSYGALLLGHELGHLIDVYGPNQNDRTDQVKNDMNTQKVYDACFK